jgi:hypothetical protein
MELREETLHAKAELRRHVAALAGEREENRLELQAVGHAARGPAAVHRAPDPGVQALEERARRGRLPHHRWG